VGLLLTPIMLDLNMAPESVAATSALMHLLSAMAALVNYAIAGDLLWQHCLVFFFCSTAGQVFGQIIVDHLVKSSKHLSQLIFVCLLIFVNLSCLKLFAAIVCLHHFHHSGIFVFSPTHIR
jgi:uncharacterized membrane protein YfcA